MRLQSFARRLFGWALTIQGKLLLSALGETLLVVVFSLFLIGSSRQISAINANESRATSIVQTITEIRFVTFENLLHHDDRSYNQWQTKHAQLADQLNSFPVSDNSEQALIDSIREQQATITPVFAKLVASYNQPVTSQNIVAQNQYQERLASQLISKQQIEISSAFKLADLQRDNAIKLRQRTSSLAVAVILLMFIITGANFIFVYGTISRALVILQRGANELSKGKFDFRIKYKRQQDEFGTLATIFNNMAANLKQVDKVKSEFVLLVSHQLRTPATAVKGFLSMLDDKYYGPLSSKQHALLASAFDENERQIKLINEILAVAQIDTGELVLNRRPTNLEEVIKNILAEQQITITAQGQTAVLEVKGEIPEVLVDTEKIRIAIENLVHNAAKFSLPGSVTKIRLHRNEKGVEIIVQDEGIGVAEDDLNKLFKKFSRVSSPGSVKTEGTGLGLYMTKRIIDLHGGEINVTSVVNKGTTFTVQLPYKKEG